MMAENTVLEVQELTREFTRRGKPFAAVDHVVSGWTKASSWRSSAARAMAKAHC